MRPTEVRAVILELGHDARLDFQQKAGRITAELNTCSTKGVLEHLDSAGVIPEEFDHDSTEEKLFAKYCDALLAGSFRELGLKAEAIIERSDAADVRAEGSNYALVGDAKAFRLSRTAKNQKDFKVEALNQWRKGADFAVLVCPIYQYPNTDSQIYQQATKYNVALLSYTHLAFLIRHASTSARELKKLWAQPAKIGVTKDASAYWSAMDAVMLAISGQDAKQWKAALSAAMARLPEQAAEQIRYWEGEKERVRRLSHSAAITRLIEALKIDAKIDVIRRTARRGS